MELKYKLWIVGILFIGIVVGYLVYQHNTIKKLNEQLQLINQNNLASQDQVKKLSEGLYERLSYIIVFNKKTTDSLNKLIGIESSKIISLTTALIELKHQISAGTGPISADTITKSITYPLGDSSKFINYRGYVRIDSAGGEHKLDLWLDSLIMSVPIYFDDSGKVHAAVKFNTDELTVTELSVYLTSEFPSPKQELAYNTIWKRFGIYTSTDFSNIEYGLVVRPFTFGRVEKRYKLGINTTFYEIMELLK